MALKLAPESPFLPSPPQPDVYSIVGAWANWTQTLYGILKDIAYRTNRVLPKNGSEQMTGPVWLANYTMATRPTLPATTKGALIWVTDGGAGANVQAWSGAGWVNVG